MSYFILFFGLGILILISIVNVKCDFVFAGNSNELDRSNQIAQFGTGQKPTAIAINEVTNKIYVVNTEFNSVSIFDARNMKPTLVRVGIEPQDIAINKATNKVYITNKGSNTVSIIDAINDTKIRDVAVGKKPDAVLTDPLNYYTYVANLDSDTISVIDGVNDTKIKDIEVGNWPISLAFADRSNEKLYVTIYGWNAAKQDDSDVVAVIDTLKLDKVKEIRTNYKPSYVYVDLNDYLAYVVNSYTTTISVIDTSNDTKIDSYVLGEEGDWLSSIVGSGDKLYATNTDQDILYVIQGLGEKNVTEIPVGNNPSHVAIDENMGILYVSNSGSNTVSLISTHDYKKIKEIPVGNNPSHVAINNLNGLAYVVNTGSNTISIIQNDRLVISATFNVFPPESGHIMCNDKEMILNQYYILSHGTNCTTKHYEGFQFTSWVENIGSDSRKTLNKSQTDGNLFTQILNPNRSNNQDPSSVLNLSSSGNFTAYFKAVPPPVPAEYWASLFTVVITALIGSLLIPSTVEWLKSKKRTTRLKSFHSQIALLSKDGTLDENDAHKLNNIDKNIADSYAAGKINNEQFTNLKHKVSIAFQEILKKRIESLPEEDTSVDDKQKEIEKDITDAYSKGKLTELHYNLLNRKIDEMINGDEKK